VKAFALWPHDVPAPSAWLELDLEPWGADRGPPPQPGGDPGGPALHPLDARVVGL